MRGGLPSLLLTALVLTAPAQLHAQFSATPVLATPPNVLYPPIARVAHISGEVTVTFSINPDGTTASVQAVSGPPMLAVPTVNAIKQWRFKTPLPLNAQTDFEARYSFRIKTDEDEDSEDSLDTPPPYTQGGGDVIFVKASGVTLTGDVHSLDGSQTIDVTASTPAPERCPDDSLKQLPTKTDLSDSIELSRHDSCYSEDDCNYYRVRVSRSGLVDWQGVDDVAVKGDRNVYLDPAATETLFKHFESSEFWSGCSVPARPSLEAEATVEASSVDKDGTQLAIPQDKTDIGVYITVRIGGIAKTVDAFGSRSFANAEDGKGFAWIIDRAANTHRWRHPDPAIEPYDNMYDDLETPKPGMTLLIRATNHFNPYTGQQTFTYLDKLLKRGEPVDDADASGWTALMYASYLDPVHYDAAQPDPIKLLLDAHADPNRTSLHGDTALMFAAYRGTLLQPLLAHGANINAHNADGVTALMLLTQLPDPDELKEALAAGADANAHDNLGRTALDYLRAASCGKPIVPLPKSRGGMVILTVRPTPCPADTPPYKQSESLFEAAMKMASGPRSPNQ
jgi:TonB family protein